MVHSCFSFTYVDNAVVLLLVDCDIGMSYALVCVVLALVLLLPLTYNNNKVREESVRERENCFQLLEETKLLHCDIQK